MANFTVRYETTTEAETPLQAALQVWVDDMRQGPGDPMLEVELDDDTVNFYLGSFDNDLAGHLKKDVMEFGATAIEVEAVLDNEGEVLTVDTKGGDCNVVALYFRLGPDFYGVCEARHIEDYRVDELEDAYTTAMKAAAQLGVDLHLPVVLKPSLKLAGLTD